MIPFERPGSALWPIDVQVDRLREVLAYDPVSGVFRYRIRPARRVRIGDIAGAINSEGYRHIVVDGRRYKAHRLAWLYVHGSPPAGLIDHVNGKRDDNRIANLRLATHSQNSANSAVNRRGKSAPKGVSYRRSVGRWVARIQCNGERRFLGLFDTPESAAVAYRDAARAPFGPFSKEPQ